MKVLLIERDLMWSAKLAQGLRILGHEPVSYRAGEEHDEIDLAIFNLSEAGENTPAIIERLKEHGVKILAHAGHKEKELLELGRTLGVDHLATNGELAQKLPDVLQRMG